MNQRDQHNLYKTMYKLFKNAIKKGQSEGLASLLTSAFQYFQSRLKRYFIKFSIQIKYKIRYGMAAPPRSTVIHVNPSNIEHFVYPAFYRDIKLSRIEGGEWDKEGVSKTIRSHDRSAGRALFPIQEYDMYQSMYDHFENGKKWSNTEFYSIAKEKIKNNGTYYHGCATISELDSRFEYVDKLYEKIKADGYKSSVQLGNGSKDEVIVNITKDGQIVMDDGRHRLFIAKILDLDSIPVWVHVRHKEWQKKRVALWNGGDNINQDDRDYRTIRDHPDICKQRR